MHGSEQQPPKNVLILFACAMNETFGAGILKITFHLEKVAVRYKRMKDKNGKILDYEGCTFNSRRL